MAKEESIVTQIDTETGKPGESVRTIEGVEEQSAQPNIEVDIQDDTPKKDRGRKSLEKPAELAIGTEEEIEGVLKEYDVRNQARIKDLRHAFHDTRRLKEAAERERDEAISLAKRAFTDTINIRNEQAAERIKFVQQLQAKSVGEVEAAKRQYKQAYEAGDSEQLVNAQETLSKAQINQDVLARWRPPVQTPPLQEAPNQVYNAQPQSDPDSEAWARENPWFTDQKQYRMKNAAMGVHEELVSEGVDPIRDADVYYDRINEAMREMFPKYGWGQNSNGDETPSIRTPVKREVRTATVVAPVQRTTRGTRVTLTTSQVSLAKRLGITPEQYARELVKTTGVQ